MRAGICPARANMAALRDARGWMPWRTRTTRMASVAIVRPGWRPGNSQLPIYGGLIGGIGGGAVAVDAVEDDGADQGRELDEDLCRGDDDCPSAVWVTWSRSLRRSQACAWRDEPRGLPASWLTCPRRSGGAPVALVDHAGPRAIPEDPTALGPPPGLTGGCRRASPLPLDARRPVPRLAAARRCRHGRRRGGPRPRDPRQRRRGRGPRHRRVRRPHPAGRVPPRRSST